MVFIQWCLRSLPVKYALTKIVSKLTIKEFKGEDIDWQSDYEDYMMIGVDVFREFVEAWYDGRLQSILFTQKDTAEKIEKKVVSVLSGYVWDENNMFVHSPTEAVNTTYKFCID